MVRHVVTFGFDDLDLHRIGLRVFTFNDAALACYERVGFSREGALRDARHHDDEYWSLVQMSILGDEWEELDWETLDSWEHASDTPDHHN